MKLMVFRLKKLKQLIEKISKHTMNLTLKYNNVIIHQSCMWHKNDILQLSLIRELKIQ